MKSWGYGLLLLGMLVMLRAWTMDVSVPSPGGELFAGDRIVNNGLIADRQLWTQSGSLFAILGAIFIAAGALLERLAGMAAAESQPAAAAASEAPASMADEVPCPECSKFIRRQAIACKHCGAELTKA